MAPLFRVSVVFRSSFDRQSLRSLALVLSPSRSCALAINATWFTAAPVQYTWRAALRASPRPSTAVWLDWLITTETALVPCMQDIGSTTSPQLPCIHSGASNLLIRQSLREYHSVSFRPWAGTTCGTPSGDFVGQLTDCKWLWGALPHHFHPSAASNKTNC